MGNGNSYEGVDPHAVRLIRHVANSLVHSADFAEGDRDEIEQRLAIHWIRQKDRFDPSRAQLHTYIDRVIKNKAAHLVEEQRAEKRDHRLHTRVDEFAEVIEDRRPGGPARSDTRLDIGKTLSTLPPRLHDLVDRLLNGDEVATIARDLGKNRSTIYGDIERLRHHFADYAPQRRRRGPTDR